MGLIVNITVSSVTNDLPELYHLCRFEEVSQHTSTLLCNSGNNGCFFPLGSLTVHKPFSKNAFVTLITPVNMCLSSLDRCSLWQYWVGLRRTTKLSLPLFSLCFKTELENVKAQTFKAAACEPDLDQETLKSEMLITSCDKSES